MGDAEIERYMAGKQLMVVSNTQYIDFRQSEILPNQFLLGDRKPYASKALVKESQIHWLGFRKSVPTTLQLTYQRYRYSFLDEALSPYIEYYSLPRDTDHFSIKSYARKYSNDRVYAHVQFQVATNLIKQSPLEKDSSMILPWLGATFFLMLVIGRYLGSLTYPFFIELSVIMRLFRIDPKKGQIPLDPLKPEEMTPKELIQAAKSKVKDRRPLAYTRREALFEIMKMLLAKVCCCRTTAFGRSIAQGRKMIRRELDLFAFLQK